MIKIFLYYGGRSIWKVQAIIRQVNNIFFEFLFGENSCGTKSC